MLQVVVRRDQRLAVVQVDAELGAGSRSAQLLVRQLLQALLRNADVIRHQMCRPARRSRRRPSERARTIARCSATERCRLPRRASDRTAIAAHLPEQLAVDLAAASRCRTPRRAWRERPHSPRRTRRRRRRRRCCSMRVVQPPERVEARSRRAAGRRAARPSPRAPRAPGRPRRTRPSTATGRRRHAAADHDTSPSAASRPIDSRIGPRLTPSSARERDLLELGARPAAGWRGSPREDARAPAPRA